MLQLSFSRRGSSLKPESSTRDWPLMIPRTTRQSSNWLALAFTRVAILATASTSDDNSAPVVGVASDTADPVEEDDDLRPIPDRLVTELTAHRTVALRDALANDPGVAFVAALHVLCLKLFYRYALDSCLEIEPKIAMFDGQASGLADTTSAKAIDARHAAWAAQLPREPATLWDALMAFDHDSRQTLFALSSRPSVKPKATRRLNVLRFAHGERRVRDLHASTRRRQSPLGPHIPGGSGRYRSCGWSRGRCGHPWSGGSG